MEGTLSAKTLPLAHDRWREAILGFDIRGFIHRPGRENTVADCLSRAALPYQGDPTTPDWMSVSETEAERRAGLRQAQTAKILLLDEATDLEAVMHRYGGNPYFGPIVRFLLLDETPPPPGVQKRAVRRQSRDGSLYPAGP